ncbi:MAG: hypothetical protein PHO07_03020 [Pirellulales bacterium]|jgi:hypothetical protein|nr:hypothetical protein [Thermoguttaceae bacterium]MDD4786119.1 hypothetical protein [Pirellulales bacterium]MDI9442828.1 hypothetical protein [Planctomycetota bacterium]NLY99577.1 hypothetical protein [Pirellulaceae bacterium]
MRNSLLNCVAMMAVFGISPLARAQDAAADAAPPLAATVDVFTQTSVYSAPACAAPGYGGYPLQAGCPQCPRECCKDVWAGYCQQKHRSVWAAPCRGMGRCGSVGGSRVVHCRTCTEVDASDAAGWALLGDVPAAASEQPPRVPPASEPIPPRSQDSPSPPKQRLPDAETPAGSVQAPGPEFDPAAWRIGRVIK